MREKLYIYLKIKSMVQPIKKHIQEAHPDMIKEEPFYTLLVDGNSVLFSCMADDKRNTENVHYGGIFQFLLQLKMIMSKRDFNYVYVFFDDEYSGWLRWRLYKPYKANRDGKHYHDYAVSDYMKQYNATLKAMQMATYGKYNKKEKEKSEWEKFVNENFDRERDILCLMFNELFIRWNMDEITEGDDQIAYYCKNKKPNERIYIMSTDMDLSQLLDDDICIYNLQKKKYFTKSNFAETFGYLPSNVMVRKVFCGDISDNIGNIKGLSEAGFDKMMPEIKKHTVTINEVKERATQLNEERKREKKKPLKVYENITEGISNKDYEGDFYEINEMLINLKKPMLSDECKETMDAMMYAPIDPEDRNTKNLYRLILKYGIDELSGDTKFGSFFSTFKKLEEKEKKFFNESKK